jgi:Ras-related protein Rab-40
VSPLCDFNIVESFTELSRLALKRNGMERLWRASKGEHVYVVVPPLV